MLLQYGPNDLNGDNPHFSEWAHLQQNEADYLEGSDQSDQEARRVLATKMMLWEIPHFSQPEVHLVLFVNVFKYMAYLWMQESRRGDHRWEEKAAKEVQMARNYQVAKDFDPDDLSQPISAITHTPPGPEVQFSLQGSHPSQEHPRGSLHPDSNECLYTILWPCCNCGGGFKGLPWGIMCR